MLYSPSHVTTRIHEMAQEIIDHYPDQKPLFICLLKGAVPFTSKLMTAITTLQPTFNPEVEYVHISAYGDDRQASTARIYSGVSATTVENRDIIVLDDCLDRGVTYAETKKHLLDQGAQTVQLIVLANKAVKRDSGEEPLISGFHTPDVWLVGMGMDDSATAPEAERWSEYIGDVSQV